ncbi:MAG: hypothetical protein HY927_14325 [Elusimicrobia bacterium]|nr:hypothetical protein [Elusimicrobiota bacterium]
MMHRTQLYLDETRYHFLAQWARKRGASIAQAVRDLIDERMKTAGLTGKRRDPIWKAVGRAAGDGSAVAENYEDYLYGR